MNDFLAKLGDIKGYIEESLTLWKVPGLAVSIVKDGEVILAEGYGYKDFVNKRPMTPDSLLPIGSVSKSFTAMAAAILADEGKMDLDAPINQYIPAFKMFDPVAGQNISARDMLCHRSGMPRHDFMWAVGADDAFTREEIVRRIRFLENNIQFREKTQYQNHMFTIVGRAIEMITGKTWEEFVKERIMSPLDMNNSNFDVAESQKTLDFALPHRLNKNKEITPVDFLQLSSFRPAGGINSTANDMAKWMKLMQDKGLYKNTRIVSEDKITEMHTPHMHFKNTYSFEFPEILFTSLGLGWITEVYRGRKMVYHSGDVTGFTALFAFLPEENFGVCTLANMESTHVTYTVRNEIFDRFIGAAGGNWNARYKAEADKSLMEAEENKAEALKGRIKGTRPTLDFSAYVGEYEHPGYGLAVISENKESPNSLKAMFNGREYMLEHFHYDQFILNVEIFNSELPLRFSIGRNGEIESFSVPFEPALEKDIVFKRK